MARYTRAYSSFITRLNEVAILRRAAGAKERSDPIRHGKEISALCRSAVVLLSAHLEAYVRDLGEIALESLVVKNVPRAKLTGRFYYHISQDLLAEIKDTSDPEKIGEKVFQFLARDVNLWSRSGPFPATLSVERFSKGFANPAFKKISSYFNRFGYSDYKNDLASSLKAAFNPTVNMVNHLVDTRNLIAHGDPSASKTPAEVDSMTVIVRGFCGTTDTLFAGWWKSGFCSMR